MFDTTLSKLPQVDIYPHPLPKKKMRYVNKQTSVGENYRIRIYSSDKLKYFYNMRRRCLEKFWINSCCFQREIIQDFSKIQHVCCLRLGNKFSNDKRKLL